MYFASYKDTGDITGFREVGDVYPTPTPIPYIIITKEQHKDYFDTGQRYRVIDGVWTYVEPPGPTLDDIKTAIRAAINAERDQREQGGFEYRGKVFDSDPTSVIRINAAVNTAVAAVLGDTPFSVNWTAADNTTVTLDAQALLGLSAALAQHSNEQHVQARSLKDQLDQAETEEAVAEVENLLSAWKQEA